MDEDYIDIDSLSEFIKNELYKTYTVKEAIEAKKEEDELVKESFAVLWNNFNALKNLREISINNLTATKYKIMLLKIFTMLFRGDLKETIDDLLKIINDANDELLNEKDLLILIRNSLKDLQKYSVTSVNNEMTCLIYYLYEKYSAIYNGVCEDINNTSLIIKGYNIQGTNKYKDEIKELNSNIDETLLSLGLKK